MKFTIDLDTSSRFVRPELLLHPPVPPEMHGRTPRELMGQAQWDKVRKAAYAENNHCCWACGIHKTEARYRQWLEGHERYDIDYKKGVMRLKDVVALCHLCHQFIHKSRAAALHSLGKMPWHKYRDIILHGSALLNKHTPTPWWDYKKMRKDMEKGKRKLKWGDWKLIYDGTEYRSKFASKAAWDAHYTGKAREDK